MNMGDEKTAAGTGRGSRRCPAGIAPAPAIGAPAVRWRMLAPDSVVMVQIPDPVVDGGRRGRPRRPAGRLLSQCRDLPRAPRALSLQAPVLLSLLRATNWPGGRTSLLSRGSSCEAGAGRAESTSPSDIPSSKPPPGCSSPRHLAMAGHGIVGRLLLPGRVDARHRRSSSWMVGGASGCRCRHRHRMCLLLFGAVAAWGGDWRILLTHLAGTALGGVALPCSPSTTM